MNPDIQSREDIQTLVDVFYSRAIKDDTIGYFFTDTMQLSLEEHLPRIYDFWESILFHKSLYKGNVMLKHIELNRLAKISDQQIDHWLFLWEQSVDQLFQGEFAAEAKHRASLMTQLMKFKLSQSSELGFIQ